jgi:signal peptidase I
MTEKTIEKSIEPNLSPNPDNSNPTPLPKPQSFGQMLWKEWVRPIGEAVIIAFIVTTFLFTTVGISGSSDVPTVLDGERVFVPKYETWLHRLGIGQFQRGDLVVVKPPVGSPQSERPIPVLGNFSDKLTYRPFFIKRVVGIPGDHIRLVKGQLYVNGYGVDESHTTAYWNKKGLWDQDSSLSNSLNWFPESWAVNTKMTNKDEYIVPDGYYFVMGDNRSSGGSEDSRTFGPVKLEEFSGRATVVWWPPFASVTEVKGKDKKGADMTWYEPNEKDGNGKELNRGSVKLRLRGLDRPADFQNVPDAVK